MVIRRHRRRYLNELQVNGQDQNNNQNQNNNDTGDTTTDDPTNDMDMPEGPPDDGTNGGAGDNNSGGPADNPADFTVPGGDTSNTGGGAETGSTDATAPPNPSDGGSDADMDMPDMPPDDFTDDNPDNQAPQDNSGDDAGMSPPDDSGSGSEDFTDDNPDNQQPPDGADANAGGGDDTSTADTSTDDTGGGDDGDSYSSKIAGLEKEIITDLSDQQQNIRDKELKNNYLLLYNNVDEIQDRLSDIPKDADMVKPIGVVINQLLELNDRIYDYLSFTYNTKTYSENLVNYYLFLDALNKINNLIKDVKKYRKNKK